MHMYTDTQASIRTHKGMHTPLARNPLYIFTRLHAHFVYVSFISFESDCFSFILVTEKELRILVPAKLRRQRTELIIEKRLKEHFDERMRSQRKSYVRVHICVQRVCVCVCVCV